MKNIKIIMPKLESLNKLSEEHLLRFKKAVMNVNKYFTKLGYSLQAYATDETIQAYFLQTNIEILQNILPEDRYFIQEVMREKITEGTDIEDSYVDTRHKFPIKRGLSAEEREKLVVKRAKQCAVIDIKSSKFVVDFGLKNNAQFKVEGKQGDRRLVIKVDLDTLHASAVMSGTPIDIFYLFKDKMLSTAIDTWE